MPKGIHNRNNEHKKKVPVRRAYERHMIDALAGKKFTNDDERKAFLAGFIDKLVKREYKLLDIE